MLSEEDKAKLKPIDTSFLENLTPEEAAELDKMIDWDEFAEELVSGMEGIVSSFGAMVDEEKRETKDAKYVK